MQYTINELRQKIFSHVYDVYEIFQNFFEPQFVDLQNIPDDNELRGVLDDHDIEHHSDGEAEEEKWDVSPRKMTAIKGTWSTLKPFILVWWPRVTVTNENNRSIVIQDLYAQVTLTMDGTIPYECRGFRLTRTTFPEVQYDSGYLHSHIPHFSGVPHFDNPCLGTGPINNTIMDLKNGYEETVWMLFCQELSLYVTVESLRGGPYFRLEHVGSERKLPGYYGYSSISDYSVMSLTSLRAFFGYESNDGEAQFIQMVMDFTSYYLRHGHLALNYKDGQFVHGMPYFDFMVDISNSFIGFFNKHGNREEVDNLYNRGILVRALAANNQFYEERQRVSSHDFSTYEGQDMFVFKGEMKHLHIDQEGEVQTETILLLNHKIAMFILHNVLKIINYRYRNEYNSKHTGDSSTAVAPTYQTVIYL